MTLLGLEGIDFSGKGKALDILIPKFGITKYNLYDLADYQQKKQAFNSGSLEDRFRGYFKLNQELYTMIMQKHKPVDRVLIERFWLSTIAYHNVLMGKRFEEDPQIYKAMSQMKPDEFLLVTTTAEAIARRMIARPPEHKYEADAAKLLRVQDEYVRILEKLNHEMQIPYHIIHNPTDSEKDLQERIDAVTPHLLVGQGPKI